MRNKGVQQWSYKNHQTINKLITNKMKKTLFFLFIFISANAQNKRTINLEIAGTLFSKINTEINNISDITLTGNINNEDIIVLRNMVQNGSLEYVDMFDSYIHGEGDEDNVIPEEAFKNCTNLKSIILPQKTLALGYESFYMCTNLSDITLPEQITTFSGSVFWGCEKLNKIDIPNSVTWIGPYSFYGCIGINKLTIKSKCAILKHSFDNCKNLQEIIFPESMDYIESDAFKGCHIDKIYCTGVPFSIKDDSFDERTKTECKLFVPNGMYNKYAWESKYWSEFKNIKEYNQNTVDNECVSFNNVNIRVIRRNIVLETVQNTHVSIYNINGTLVFSSSVKNNVSIPLQSGFYIVKYNDETKKIAIL